MTVVKLLRHIELLQDQTFAATGKLMTALVDARIEQGLSPIVGKQIRAAIAQVVANVSEGLGNTGNAHRLLEQLGKSRGLDVTMYGDVDKNAAYPA